MKRTVTALIGRRWCDGTLNCPMGSDEDNCPSNSCRYVVKRMVTASIGRRCVTGHSTVLWEVMRTTVLQLMQVRCEEDSHCIDRTEVCDWKPNSLPKPFCSSQSIHHFLQLFTNQLTHNSSILQLKKHN